MALYFLKLLQRDVISPYYTEVSPTNSRDLNVYNRDDRESSFADLARDSFIICDNPQCQITCIAKADVKLFNGLINRLIICDVSLSDSGVTH